MSAIDRYIGSDMAYIFSNEFKLSAWTAVSLAAIESRFELSATDLHDLRRVKPPTELQWIQRERVTRHDLVAFLDVLRRSLPEHLRPKLHLGLTSSDVVDTALAITLREAGAAIVSEATHLATEVAQFSLEHWNTNRLGRTHGQPAEVTTLGIQFSRYALMLRRSLQAVSDATAAISVGRMGGPIGLCRYWTADQEGAFNRRLGLGGKPSGFAGQTLPRDAHARWVASLVALGGVVEAIALEIRLGAQYEIRELAEPRGDAQVGSSAMTHKQNPIDCERVCGLAEVLRAQLAPAFSGIATWGERDISHSSVERLTYEKAAALTHFMLFDMRRVLGGLKVDAMRMAANLHTADPLPRMAHYQKQLQEAGVSLDDIRATVRDIQDHGDVTYLRKDLEGQFGHALHEPPLPQSRVTHIRRLLTGPTETDRTHLDA